MILFVIKQTRYLVKVSKIEMGIKLCSKVLKIIFYFILIMLMFEKI